MVQRLAQAREVRIEGYEPGRALKERSATRLIAQTVQLTLSITGRQTTAAGKSN